VVVVVVGGRCFMDSDSSSQCPVSSLELQTISKPMVLHVHASAHSHALIPVPARPRQGKHLSENSHENHMLAR